MNIGEHEKETYIEPLPKDVPVQEPSPAAPEKGPERVKEPV